MKNRFSLFATLLVLTGCATANIEQADPNPTPHDMTAGPGVFSKDGNLLSNFQGSGGKAVAMQVNPYLWRSALQSVSFMPLIQADSMGGVILSDWITQENNIKKQVKVNVYVLSKKLDPNALNVKVFEREKQADGSYSIQKIDEATSVALEETILSNARSLKIKALAE